MEIIKINKFKDKENWDLIISYEITDKGLQTYWLYNKTKNKIEGYEKEEYKEKIKNYFKN